MEKPGGESGVKPTFQSVLTLFQQAALAQGGGPMPNALLQATEQGILGLLALQAQVPAADSKGGDPPPVEPRRDPSQTRSSSRSPRRGVSAKREQVTPEPKGGTKLADAVTPPSGATEEAEMTTEGSSA